MIFLDLAIFSSYNFAYILSIDALNEAFYDEKKFTEVPELIF